jgi:DNA-binding transcriptional ArsR family regulator
LRVVNQLSYDDRVTNEPERSDWPGHVPAGSRRLATGAEARALASPLRMRILRLCFDEELTNEQLAARLGRDPGTTLHHVRTLVAAGFLEPTSPRPGKRKSLERPYRATGKSWTVEVSDPQLDATATNAAVEAFVAEARETDPTELSHVFRLALRLPAGTRDEIGRRVHAVLQEYAGLPPDEDGEAFAVFFATHPRSPTRPAG